MLTLPDEGLIVPTKRDEQDDRVGAGQRRRRGPSRSSGPMPPSAACADRSARRASRWPASSSAEPSSARSRRCRPRTARARAPSDRPAAARRRSRRRNRATRAPHRDTWQGSPAPPVRGPRFPAADASEPTSKTASPLPSSPLDARCRCPRGNDRRGPPGSGAAAAVRSSRESCASPVGPTATLCPGGSTTRRRAARADVVGAVVQGVRHPSSSCRMLVLVPTGCCRRQAVRPQSIVSLACPRISHDVGTPRRERAANNEIGPLCIQSDCEQQVGVGAGLRRAGR